MNKSTPILLLLSLTLGSISFADSKAKAIELMNALEIRKNIDTSMAQVIGFSDKMIEAQNLDPETKNEAINASHKTLQATIEAINGIDWESIFADIYAEVFAEDEIQGLIDFYHSPVGKKLLEKQPQLMGATMTRMQTEMAKFMPQVQQAAMQAVQEAKASHSHTAE